MDLFHKHTFLDGHSTQRAIGIKNNAVCSPFIFAHNCLFNSMPNTVPGIVSRKRIPN